MTDDGTTDRLLQLAGRRPEVSAARAARVRAGVHEAWRVEVRRRRVRRTLLAAPIAAAAAAALFVIVVSRPQINVPPASVVGTVERVDGIVQIASNESGAAARRLSATDRIGGGDWISTDGSARAALRIASGASVRVDHSSRVRFVTGTIIELTAGAVYLDTGSHAVALEIRTPLGVASDIGTQFEVRLVAESLRVRVRTGAVAVHRDRESIQVESGTELTLTSKGAESRTVPRSGVEWDWASSVAPSFQIEGQPLHAFLEQLSRENGWILKYADPALARDASVIVLHGSVEGLSPADALGVALTSAALSYSLERGDLMVSRSETSK